MKRPKTSKMFRYYDENWKVPLAFLLEKKTILGLGILAFLQCCSLWVFFSCSRFVCIKFSFFVVDKFLRRDFQKGFTLF